jgi:phenylpropionate dioxygenase-like ring-hydroxylating dioxygenase large terminal subunit/AcrR family transcriptional regulator
MDSDSATDSHSGVKDKRKQQLIDAAIKCIHRHGLEKSTISRVTTEAGLSAGIVNFHFESKDKLLLEVLEFVRDEFHRQLVESVQPGDGPEEILTRLIRIHFTPSLCSPEKIAVWHAFSGLSHNRDDYNRICDGLDREVRKLIMDSIEALCMQEGMAHYHPGALGQGLEGLLEFLWQSCLYWTEEFDHDHARRPCMQYLASLFPGVFPMEADPDAAVATMPQGKPGQGNPGQESDLLPRWTYDNSDFLKLEIEQIFKTHWMLAGHVSEVSESGNFITFDAFGEQAVILQDSNGRLRAFHNVCRHRGARLLEGRRGKCPGTLSCPFHGWSYDLEGNLIAIPARDTFDCINTQDNSLVPVELEIWMGFIFLRFRSGGPALADSLDPVRKLIAPYRIDEMEPLPGTAYDYVRPYNWKVIHDIDNEGYHVPVGHPALQQLYGRTYRDGLVENIPVSTARIESRPGRKWSVRHYQKLLPDFEHLPVDYRRTWQYIGIFPNQVIGLYPDSVEFYMTIPVAIGATRYLGCSFALPDERREARAARYLNRRINNQTELEDERFVRAMQDGLRSSAFPEQKLSSREQGVRDFHRSVQTILPVARLAAEPADGNVARINREMQSS